MSDDAKDVKKVKAAKARSAGMTKEKRSEIASKAAKARWGNGSKVLRATHGDPERPLRIGEIEIPCYVLDGGMRVLSGRGMQSALDLGQGHGALLTQFLSSPNLKPFITNDLAMVLASPVRFVRPGRGGVLAVGYEATILADICDCVLAARKAGELNKRQLAIADQCETLARAFARVGIIALVDEATGYQYSRARDGLRKILEQYVSKELARWEKTFEQEYYEHLYRLKGWAYDPTSNKRTHACARCTVNLIYDRIHPDLLHELKTVRDDAGKPNSKLFQWLTTGPNGGHPRLKQHQEGVVSLMSVAQDWEQFEYWMDRRYPRLNDTMRIPFKEMDIADDSSQQNPPANKKTIAVKAKKLT